MSLMLGNDPSNVARPVSVDTSGRVDVNSIMSGKDSGGTARVLLVDANGQPLVVAKNQVKSSGGTWYDQLGNSNGAAIIAPEQANVLDGTNAVLLKTQDNTDLSAGANNIDSSSVSVGEIWEITRWTYMYSGTTAGVSMYINIVYSATNYLVAHITSFTTLVYQALDAHIFVPSGGKIRFELYGCTLHNAFYSRFLGRTIKTS